MDSNARCPTIYQVGCPAQQGGLLSTQNLQRGNLMLGVAWQCGGYWSFQVSFVRIVQYVRDLRLQEECRRYLFVDAACKLGGEQPSSLRGRQSAMLCGSNLWLSNNTEQISDMNATIRWNSTKITSPRKETTLCISTDHTQFRGHSDEDTGRKKAAAHKESDKQENFPAWDASKV